MKQPFVSVIIPVLNDFKRLIICLKALEQQTYPEELYEVIVVDNGSFENIELLIKECPRALLTYEAKRGSYAARNHGIAMSSGEILAFTDSDCIPTNNWIENGVKALLSIQNYGLVAGKIEFFFKHPDSPSVLEVFDSITNLQQEKYVKKYHFGATANLFTYKQLFEELEYFNSDLQSGGDAEWGSRVFSHGYVVSYSEDCCVFHPARNSLKQLIKKVIRQTKGSCNRNPNKSLTWQKAIALFWSLKPPLRSAFRKAFSADKLKLKKQKLNLFFIILIIYYIKVWEEIRLSIVKS
ncbi:MAG: glycosyltransferase [Hydrococcus sp. Prado102]|jgi:glycosyltransferase involved in cell wall biosynthesis|nr:glycosyltransferase [Hydrococcus sp. Prado102]